MQREGAEHGLLRQDAEHRHGGVALALAGQRCGRFGLGLGLARYAAEVMHDHHVLLRGLAAQACIGAHALLGLFQLGGQALGGDAPDRAGAECALDGGVVAEFAHGEGERAREERLGGGEFEAGERNVSTAEVEREHGFAGEFFAAKDADGDG